MSFYVSYRLSKILDLDLGPLLIAEVLFSNVGGTATGTVCVYVLGVQGACMGHRYCVCALGCMHGPQVLCMCFGVHAWATGTVCALGCMHGPQVLCMCLGCMHGPQVLCVCFGVHAWATGTVCVLWGACMGHRYCVCAWGACMGHRYCVCALGCMYGPQVHVLCMCFGRCMYGPQVHVLCMCFGVHVWATGTQL